MALRKCIIKLGFRYQQHTDIFNNMILEVFEFIPNRIIFKCAIIIIFILFILKLLRISSAEASSGSCLLLMLIISLIRKADKINIIISKAARAQYHYEGQTE